jgi:hypothetical protein
VTSLKKGAASLGYHGDEAAADQEIFLFWKLPHQRK